MSPASENRTNGSVYISCTWQFPEWELALCLWVARAADGQGWESRLLWIDALRIDSVKEVPVLMNHNPLCVLGLPVCGQMFRSWLLYAPVAVLLLCSITSQYMSVG